MGETKKIARRYNSGKLRYQLITPIGLSKLAEVYTKGASKYTLYNEDGSIKEDGSNNWKKGLPFTDIIDSAKRHIQAWESGEDIDPDLQSQHLANAAWNIMTILHLTETNPEFDNRDVWYKKPFKKLWLDLDGVIFDFEQSLLEKLGYPADRHPTDWNDPVFRAGYDQLKMKDSFWAGLPILLNPIDLKYPIAGYCTSRSTCPNEITQAALDYHGFPTAPIINSGHEPKSKFLLEVGCEIMVDDSINNFVDCQSNGIVCYLMDRPHNQKYNVGHWRIKSLQDLFNKLMS
jgi:hypothetical protein